MRLTAQKRRHHGNSVYRSLAAAGACGLLMVAFSAAPGGAASGDLDPAFGSGGITQWNPTARIDFVFAVVHQPDGKIVSAGMTRDVSADLNEDDLLLSRHNADGTLDATFGGGDGVVITAVGELAGSPGTDDHQEQAYGLALQPDGKIVVAGNSCGGCNPQNHVLARYHPDGTLDTSFGGGDGTARLDLRGTGGADGAYAVAVAASGRILTAGYVKTNSSCCVDWAVVAFDPSGSLDTTFGGGDGMVITDFGARDEARAIVVQPDGRLVVGGVAGLDLGAGAGNFALARYHPDGDLDLSFSGDGKQITDFGGFDEVRDVALDANARIVAAGRAANGVLGVARYTLSGGLDPSFSVDGRATVTGYSLSPNPVQDIGVEVQVDGKPVVGGVVGQDAQRDFGVARFTVSGELDPTLGGDGVTTVDIAGDPNWGNDVSLDAAGDIVVAGSTDGPAYPDGSHDISAVLMRFHGELAASACPGMTITNTVVGTPGDDTLVGSAGSDFIYGLGGDDTITGTDGDDCIYGGTGNDVIDAGGGNDRIFAEAGADTLVGGPGLDKTAAGPGADTIRIAAADVPAASTEGLKGKAGTDTVELGAGLTTGDVTGAPPTFTVTDPITGGTYSAVNVEAITDI